MAIIETPPQPQKRSHRSNEGKIQADCYRWCYNERPETRKLLFHVANENDRADSNAIQGAIRKSLGLVAGVADLILLMPRGEYHGLCIEMKDAHGTQKPAQKEWQIIVENQGYLYRVIRSLEEFKELINWYLSL